MESAMGRPPLVAELSDRARHHRVLARLSASSEHAAAARRIFGDLGMAFWRARV
jgi:hypothetical protein